MITCIWAKKEMMLTTSLQCIDFWSPCLQWDILLIEFKRNISLANLYCEVNRSTQPNLPWTNDAPERKFVCPLVALHYAITSVYWRWASLLFCHFYTQNSCRGPLWFPTSHLHTPNFRSIIMSSAACIFRPYFSSRAHDSPYRMKEPGRIFL